MKVDPITVEVVRNAVNAYADEMATALCKSAYNMMIYEVRDFCCGLIDGEGRMISQNQGGLPIFLADLGIAVKDGIARYGLDGFAPGDVVIMNHGEVCGQHLNNVVIYAPCFHDGKVVAFAASRAHWVDIGGSRVGFGSVETTEIYQEGIQFRSLKIYEAGKRNETLWQIIHDNVRFPEAALGDLRAQIACCQLGIRRFGELLRRYGRETVETCIGAVWDATEREARAFIAKIPDGTYEAESFLDNDGRTLDVPLRIKVKVTIDGERMIVDFSQMNEQTAGPINSGYSGGLAAARVAFKCLTQPQRAGQRRLLPAARNHSAGRQNSQRQAAGRARAVEHRAADRHRHHPQGAGAGAAGADSGRAQGRHGRLLDRRLSARRPALPADEHFRRRLGRPAARGRRIRLGVDLPGRRAQRADRTAGDPVSVPDRALRAAHGFRRRRPPSRRPWRRNDLSGAAALRRQRQLRAHQGSALGPQRRQARRGQRSDAHSPRRQRAASSRRRPACAWRRATG